MTHALNRTHDPDLMSWVESANLPDADYPIQNLPFGVFLVLGGTEPARCGVAIGRHIVDVSRCVRAFTGPAHDVAAACGQTRLNTLMALEPAALSEFRAQLSALLAEGNEQGRALLTPALVDMAACEMLLPVSIGGYTDFFASIHHATNAGRLFRPDAPLLPNYKHVPIAYNGRANSIRLGGGPVQRPWGQTRPADADAPGFNPARRLDYEVELGIYIGAASRQGEPVPVGAAGGHVFGFCLLNDWSARDIQAWEYQPLGPFLAKTFATSVSAWVVTAEAMAPFRLPAPVRPPGDPAPLPYLHDAADQACGGVAIVMEAHLRTQAMAAAGLPALRLSCSNTAELYWTVAQMVAHHTSNGSALDTGDLFGSGTVSGPEAEAVGSLMEISRGGTEALVLPATGETRCWLADGDELTLVGYCEKPGFRRIGFGRCTGTVAAARAA